MYKRAILTISVFALMAAGAFAQGGSKTTDSTSADKPAKAPVFRPTKEQIREGQQILIKEKFYTGEATGVYGESRPAVKAYQKAHGLEENGKFDKATLEKMGIALTDSQKGISSTGTAGTSSKAKTSTADAATSKDGPKRPAPFTATKDQIVDLQKVLIGAKLFSGEATGERSDALKQAVMKYQESNKLKATGGINAETLQKAGIALTEKQKEQVAAQAAFDAAKKKD